MSEHHTGRCRRFAAVVCGLVLTAGLASCSENPEPQPLEDTTAAASSTPSPTPSRSPNGAPTMPPEAKGTSKQAAIAFVEHWVEVLNYAVRSLDTKPLKRLGSESCEVCGVVVERIQLVAEQGGTFRGRGWQIREMQPLTSPSRGTAVINTVIDIAPQVVTTGDRPETFDGGTVLYTFHLKGRDSAWVIDRLDRAT